MANNFIIYDNYYAKTVIIHYNKITLNINGLNMIRLLILLSLMCSFLRAEILLTDDKKIFDTFDVKYLHDKSGLLTINEISKRTFTKQTTDNFTFGYRDDAVWFKFKIKNNSSKEDYILHFSEAIWKSFDLYEYKDSKWRVHKNGLSIPLKERDISDIHPAFNISVQRGQSRTFYIRGETIASQIGEFCIFSQEEYYAPSKFTVVDLYMIFAFALFTIFWLNIYSYFLTKEKIYIYYMSYTLSFIVFSAMHSGIYLLAGFAGWNEGLHFVGAVVILTLLLFSRKFLELDRNAPVINRFFNFSVVMFGAFALLILFDLPYVNELFNIYSTIFFIILFYAVVKVFMQGNTSARYYLIALIIYTPLMSLMILTFNSILEYNEFYRHLFLLGAFIEIIFFTLILAGRYRTINLQKMKLQEELLYEKESQKQILQEQIESKTKDIQEIINKFEFATESALAGYWEFNLDTKKSFFSSGWYRFLGYNADDISNLQDSSGQAIAERIIHKDDQEKVKNATKDYLSKKTDVYNVEFRVLHKDDHYSWVKAVGSVYGNKFFGFHIDIDDIYKMNIQLMEQSKLAAMGEMLNNIAHQWRQPLSVISTGVTGLMLKKEMGMLEDEEFYNTCNYINENAQYLSQTIDDFRNFIRGDTKKVRFDLKNDTDSFIKLINSSVKKYHIKIILDLQEHIKVKGYPNELIQCFINIFNNSKDALVENNIDEEERFLFITQQVENDILLITFKDNAGGIDENILQNIFEPYFTTKHKSQGTGLGLHMTYNMIVTHMRGRIEAVNEEYEFNGKQYKGAKFKITLPLKI
jgi:PAS domain S-box-containing protein